MDQNPRLDESAAGVQDPVRRPATQLTTPPTQLDGHPRGAAERACAMPRLRQQRREKAMSRPVEKWTTRAGRKVDHTGVASAGLGRVCPAAFRGASRRRAERNAGGASCRLGWLFVAGGSAASGGAGVEVFAAEAVAVAFEAEDLGVVDEPVDHRGGDDVVAEDFAPGAEWLVGGDDH